MRGVAFDPAVLGSDDRSGLVAVARPGEERDSHQPHRYGPSTSTHPQRVRCYSHGTSPHIAVLDQVHCGVGVTLPSVALERARLEQSEDATEDQLGAGAALRADVRASLRLDAADETVLVI